MNNEVYDILYKKAKSAYESWRDMHNFIDEEVKLGWENPEAVIEDITDELLNRVNNVDNAKKLDISFTQIPDFDGKDTQIFSSYTYDAMNIVSDESKFDNDTIDNVCDELNDQDIANENRDSIINLVNGKIGVDSFIRKCFAYCIEDDSNLEPDEDQLAFDHQIDNISRNETELRKNSLITNDMIDNLVDEIRKFDFLFRKSDDGQYHIEPDMQNSIIDRISGIYKVTNDKGELVRCFKAKQSGTFGTELVNPDNGEETEIILDPTTAVQIYLQSGKIKYKTSDMIKEYLKQDYEDCFKDTHQNYINPAEISDPASRIILSMDIPVTDHNELKDNFMVATNYEAEECDGEFEDVAYIWDTPVASHPGHYRGRDKDITTYLCLTNTSLNKKSIITPDCLVVCDDRYDGSRSYGIFNLKTGYNRSLGEWKNDFMSLTRKIKTILKDEHMTDYKQQDHKRQYKNKINND